MKFRQGFVSNSSSSSFVVIKDKDYEYKDFKEDMGVKDKTPFDPMCKALWNELVEKDVKVITSIKELDEYWEHRTWHNDHNEKVCGRNFAVYEGLIKKGKVIIFGGVTNQDSCNPMSNFIYETGIYWKGDRILIETEG